MTREEAIEVLNGIEEVYGALPEDGNKIDEALSMAIKALEQEPCEDAVSRQAVLDYIHRILNQGTGKKKSFEFIQKYVEKQPPVKPQEPKTGHWIDLKEDNEISDDNMWRYSCNMCHGQNYRKTLFCPNCGCAMIEPQESEE